DDGRDPEDLVPTCFLRFQLIRSVWNLFLRQFTVCLHAAGEIRLAERVGGGSWIGVYLGGAYYRADLGTPGMGDLVDVGCAFNIHVRSGAALHFVFAVAVRDRRAR